MKYKVILHDEEYPQLGVLTCVVEGAGNIREAIEKAEERHPYYRAIRADLIEVYNSVEKEVEKVEN